LRCAAQGILGRYVPAARAIHLGSAALGRWHPKTVRLMARNQVLLAARHCGGRHVWPVLAAQLLWGAVAFRHGRGLAWARGKVQGLRLFSAARERWQAEACPTTASTPPVLGGAGGFACERLEQILRSNEQFIRAVSRDTYWRLYFLLTGGTK
jgi:hypothetical protein